MRNKIVHIITGLNDGGAEAILYSLCSFDCKNKHIVISLMDDGKYGSMLREIGVEVHCLNQSAKWFNPFSIFKISKILLSVRPDAVQTWMLHADLIGGIAARLAGVKNVNWGVHYTTFDKATTSTSTYLVFRLCKMLSYLVPKAIICCSNSSKTHLRVEGFDKQKLVFVANGYNFESFKPDFDARNKLRDYLAIDATTPLLGMVGRYHPQKDHKNLLQALHIVKNFGIDFRCICIGPGVDDNNVDLSEIRFNLGLVSHINFIGAQSNIKGYMNAIDLHILSSNSEAFPNVLNEAMACGTPCVTTDVGDSAFIVNDTGWVVPAKSPELLANKIIEAIQEMLEVEKFNERKQAARLRVVSNFSVQRMVENYNAVWFSD